MAVATQLKFTMQRYNGEPLNHRVLIEGPWRGSKGSMDVCKTIEEICINSL